MNTKPPLTLWPSSRRMVLGFAVLAAIGIASVPTYADPSAATAASSHVAHVALADLNLSTPEGMSAARARLEAMARRLCSKLTRSLELAYQPELANQSYFAACVHDTLADALAQVDAIRAANDKRTAQRATP